MNTKAKIAAGVVAGVIVGTTLMGSAFAAPRMLSNPQSIGYRMMGSSTATGTADGSVLSQMQSFMDRYRDANGRIDMFRMHNDVVSGKVTPPRHNRALRPRGSSARPSTGTPSVRGYGMMGGTAPVQGSGSGYGYGMMGGTY